MQLHSIFLWYSYDFDVTSRIRTGTNGTIIDISVKTKHINILIDKKYLIIPKSSSKTMYK